MDDYGGKTNYSMKKQTEDKSWAGNGPSVRPSVHHTGTCEVNMENVQACLFLVFVCVV